MSLSSSQRLAISQNDRSISQQDRILLLESELTYQRQRLEDLSTMGAILASILEIDKVQTVMMEFALREVGGEVGGILLENNGSLECSIAWGVDRNLFGQIALEGDTLLLDAYKRGSAAHCLNNGVAHVVDSGSSVRINNLLTAPISSREKRHGLVVVLNKDNGGDFTNDDLQTLSSMNNFLAVALENAQLLQSTLDKQRMEQELLVAREVQETILPSQTAQFDGYEIGALYAAANEVGGDFYEVIETGEDEFVLIIGDVSNKGVGAAMIMSACSGIIKSKLRSEPDIHMSQLAGHLNDTLSEGLIKDRGMFATIWFGRFRNDLSLEFCNAGHVPPVHCHSDNVAPDELAAGGTIVGQFPGVAFTDTETTLSVGDTVTFTTDGITEAESSTGELFGRERTMRFALKHADQDANEFCQLLKRHIDDYSRGGSVDAHDDFTVVQVKVSRRASENEGRING